MYKNKYSALLFVLPGVLLMTVFVFLPIGINFFYSLFRWSAFSADKVFLGLDNYTRLFADENIRLAFSNNVLYAIVSVICQCGIGIVVAAILEDPKMRRYQPFFRTVYFIPSIISITVIGLLWQFILNPQMGIVNPLLKAIGLGQFAGDWLGSAKTAMGSVIFVSQWQNIGYIMLLFIIAIQKIPESVLESAGIDGANGFQRFWYITVPLVKETILVTTVVTVIGAFKVFSEIYVMTGGGPGHATETLASYMYRVGFRNDEMGYSSSIATIIFLILLVLTLVQMSITREKKVKEKGA